MAPIKIGIDGIVLRGRDAGTLRYFEQLLCGIGLADATNRYVVFADLHALQTSVLPKNINLSYLNIPTSSFFPPALRQQFFPSWHALGRLDLLHCPAFVPPLSFSGKSVTTIFDLTFHLYPETMKWTGRLWWRIFGRRGIQRADRVIALSESTKRDLYRCFDVAEEKVRVIYPCTRDIFKQDISHNEIAAKYRLPNKYILYIGTLERRKNIANLVRAFSIAKRGGVSEHVLVLAGQRGWLYQDIAETIEELGLARQVVFLGYVPDEDLPGLYAGADLFAYLSLYEGFGLPVLEAMACGVPVLASNSSSIPEVIGDAGILVSPDNVEQAALEMVRILSDESLRRGMIERGLHRASHFSQERMIRETLAVYEEAMQSK